jgi:LysR family glycine cleavage system transcriptional activator
MTRHLPPLTALRSFEAAARHESFKHAAEELHVTSAAVSHQIKLLEDTLGLSLFRRRGRAVQPTEAARLFAKKLGRAFDSIEAAADDLLGNPMRGTLRIAMTPFYGNRILLPRLWRFHAAYPEIIIEPQMSASGSNFGRSDLDGGLRHGTGDWPGLTAIELHRDELVPVAAPSVVANRSLPLDTAEIARMKLGYIEGQKEDWSTWFGSVGYDGPPPGDMVAHGSRGRVVDLAFSGHGVALADSRLIAADVAAGHLVRVHETPVQTGKGMWLVYPDTDFPDPRLLAFGEWFKNEVLKICPT